MNAPRSDALDHFIDAAAVLLSLPIEPAWKDAVKGHLVVMLALAASFTEFPLPEETEPAPIFMA